MNKMSKEELELEKKRRQYEFDRASTISLLDGDKKELEPELIKIYKKYINCEISLEECNKEVDDYIKDLCSNYSHNVEV